MPVKESGQHIDEPDDKKAPIIALTASAFEEDIQQCIQAGMNEHLSKPVDIDVLVMTLGKLIANSLSNTQQLIESGVMKRFLEKENN